MNEAMSIAECDAGMTLNFKLSQLSSKLAYRFLNGSDFVYSQFIVIEDISNLSRFFFLCSNSFNFLLNLLQVIRERKWKEVIVAFNFPTTITSASFVLRKNYLSLLYHFEQVYYFHKQGPSVSMPGNRHDSCLSKLSSFKFFLQGRYLFLFSILAVPANRKLVNGSATLEEGATRNELPGQGKYSYQLVVFGFIALVLNISLIFIFVFQRFPDNIFNLLVLGFMLANFKIKFGVSLRLLVRLGL